MKGAKLLNFVQIIAFSVLCFEQDSIGASNGVSGLSMSVLSAPPGLERVWNVLEPMVQEARDTGQTELEVRYHNLCRNNLQSERCLVIEKRLTKFDCDIQVL
jgi:hypothetical protein